MIVRLVGVAVLSAGTLGFAAFRQAPQTTRYMVQTVADQSLDASAVGGALQQTHVATRSFVTITLDDTTGGRTAHLVLDSVVVDSAPAGAVEQLGALRNIAYHGILEPSGNLRDLKPVEGADQPVVRGVFNDFFPLVAGTRKAGDAWTDTVQATSPIPGGEMTTRTVTRYQAAAGEARAGAGSTLEVGTTYTSSVNGTQNTGQATATITGSASGKATYILSEGRYLGGERSSKTELLIDGVAPMPIPLTVEQTTTTSVLE